LPLVLDARSDGGSAPHWVQGPREPRGALHLGRDDPLLLASLRGRLDPRPDEPRVAGAGWQGPDRRSDPQVERPGDANRRGLASGDAGPRFADDAPAWANRNTKVEPRSAARPSGPAQGRRRTALGIVQARVRVLGSQRGRAHNVEV